uniref:Putative secreted protein n=1 Tax=Ixodes scapularis TaxID=6945 RepID=A0A4D5RZA0_IXOSC
MRWLLGAEATLTALEAQPLPDDIPLVERLIDDHKVFMEDMSKRQPDVDRVSKAFSGKRQQPPVQQPVQQLQQHPVGARRRGEPLHHDRRTTPHGPPQTTPRTETPPRGHHPEQEIHNPHPKQRTNKAQQRCPRALERQRRRCSRGSSTFRSWRASRTLTLMNGEEGSWAG